MEEFKEVEDQLYSMYSWPFVIQDLKFIQGREFITLLIIFLMFFNNIWVTPLPLFNNNILIFLRNQE